MCINNNTATLWGMATLNKDLLILRKKYQLRTTEDAKKVKARLHKICDTRKPIGFYDYDPSVLFVGSIDADSFSVTPVNKKRNAALPLITGKIGAVGNHTIIEVTIQPNSYIPLIVLLVAVTATVVLTLLDTGSIHPTYLVANCAVLLLFLLPFNHQRHAAVINLQYMLAANIQ